MLLPISRCHRLTASSYHDDDELIGSNCSNRSRDVDVRIAGQVHSPSDEEPASRWNRESLWEVVVLITSWRVRYTTASAAADRPATVSPNWLRTRRVRDWCFARQQRPQSPRTKKNLASRPAQTLAKALSLSLSLALALSESRRCRRTDRRVCSNSAYNKSSTSRCGSYRRLRAFDNC